MSASLPGGPSASCSARFERRQRAGDFQLAVRRERLADPFLRQLHAFPAHAEVRRQRPVLFFRRQSHFAGRVELAAALWIDERQRLQLDHRYLQPHAQGFDAQRLAVDRDVAVDLRVLAIARALQCCLETLDRRVRQQPPRADRIAERAATGATETSIPARARPRSQPSSGRADSPSASLRACRSRRRGRPRRAFRPRRHSKRPAALPTYAPSSATCPVRCTLPCGDSTSSFSMATPALVHLPAAPAFVATNSSVPSFSTRAPCSVKRSRRMSSGGFSENLLGSFSFFDSESRTSTPFTASSRT